MKGAEVGPGQTSDLRSGQAYYSTQVRNGLSNSNIFSLNNVTSLIVHQDTIFAILAGVVAD